MFIDKIIYERSKSNGFADGFVAFEILLLTLVAGATFFAVTGFEELSNCAKKSSKAGFLLVSA